MDLSKEKFDIIILAGQSNAEGTGLGEVEQKFVPDEKIMAMDAPRMGIDYLDAPFTFEIADEREADGQKYGVFALKFAEEYVKEGYLAQDRKVLIIRAAIGGTGFIGKQWHMEGKVYLKMLEMIDYALSLNKENKIVAMLWHQGEHDAFGGNTKDVFYGQLKALTNSIRSRYGNIPFMAGDFVNEWKTKYIELCEPIVDAIRQIVAEMGTSAFIETSDLQSNNQKIGNGDDIHFCREALQVVGQRYFDAYKKIR